MSDNAHPAFCCPTCRTVLEHQSDGWLCIGCAISYPETGRGIPVLLSDRNDLFHRADYLRASPEALLRAKGIRVIGESINAVPLTCSWIARIDKRIAGRPAGLDAASCTYFLGHRPAQPTVGHALGVFANTTEHRT